MIIMNFEFLGLNYFLDADQHEYTRFIVCCMWFVGEGPRPSILFFAGGSFTAAIQ